VRTPLLVLALGLTSLACSSAGGYCTSKWSLAPEFGSCDTGLLSSDIQVTYALPYPPACETALKQSCSAAEQTILNNQAACLNRVASAQPTCLDGGEAAWSNGLVSAQAACRDAGVSQVCATALEQSQQSNDAGTTQNDGGGDGGVIDFCKQSVSAAYHVGTCDFGDGGLNLPFIGSIVPAGEVATCESALGNCTGSDVDTLNAQVVCADGIPTKVGTCQPGNEGGFLQAAEAQYHACLGTFSNMTMRCVDALASFYPRDAG
jgi:hypothetical protein